MAYDPEAEPLDLTHEEKLRTTALMMAIRYHVDTIIKDANMYQTMVAQGKHLTPSTVGLVIHIAREFEGFLRGNDPPREDEDPSESEQSTAAS
jgi:hypothetical protein